MIGLAICYSVENQDWRYDIVVNSPVVLSAL